MITLTELNRAVCTIYQQALNAAGVGAKLSAEDVRSPIKRPCGKVELDAGSDSRLMSAGRERTVTFRLYFFAADGQRPKLDNLAVRSALGEALLDGVTVGDLVLYPTDGVDFAVSDGVLISSIDFDLIEGIPESPGEPMETLILQQEVQ